MAFNLSSLAETLPTSKKADYDRAHAILVNTREFQEYEGHKRGVDNLRREIASLKELLNTYLGYSDEEHKRIFDAHNATFTSVGPEVYTWNPKASNLVRVCERIKEMQEWLDNATDGYNDCCNALFALPEYKECNEKWDEWVVEDA